MTFVARLAPSPEAIANERVSVRVRRVCAILDCEPSAVYKLIAAGELEAHGIGSRGVRIYADSIADYRQRQKITPKNKGAMRKFEPKPAPSAASRAAHLAAMAKLRGSGLL